MKKFIVAIFIFSTPFLLTGCAQTSSKTVGIPTPTPNINTTLVGILLKSSSIVLLKDETGKTTQLDSYTQNFDVYMGKRVKVTGQYSGTTLFVDKIVQSP